MSSPLKIQANNSNALATSSKTVKVKFPDFVNSIKSGHYVAQLMRIPTRGVKFPIYVNAAINIPNRTSTIPYDFDYVVRYSNPTRTVTGTKTVNMQVTYQTLGGHLTAGTALYTATADHGLNAVVMQSDESTVSNATSISGRLPASLVLNMNAIGATEPLTSYFWVVIPTTCGHIIQTVSATQSSINNAVAQLNDIVNPEYGTATSFTVEGKTSTYFESLVRTAFGVGKNYSVDTQAPITFSTQDNFNPLGGTKTAISGSKAYYALKIDSAGLEFEDTTSGYVDINSSAMVTAPMLANKIGSSWTILNDTSMLQMHLLNSYSTVTNQDKHDVGIQFSLDPDVEVDPITATWSSVYYWYNPSITSIASTLSNLGYFNLDLTDTTLGGTSSKGEKHIYVRFRRYNAAATYDYNIQKLTIVYGSGTPVITAVRVGYLTNV